MIENEEKKTEISPKTFKRFIEYLLKTTPEEFYGIALLMGIGIEDSTSDPKNGVLRYKDTDLLLEEVLDKFCELPRQRRKKLMTILNKTVKGRK